jgi:sugar phosphate isomerase/epimerase
VSFEPVLHSVSYAGVWPGQARLTLAEFIDKASDLGFEGLMLMAKRPHLSVLDYPADACLRLRDRIEAQGLRCAVVAGYNNFTAGLEHAEIPNREIQLQHLADLCRMARDLGAPFVRIFTGYDHPALPYVQALPSLAETLREAARRAADCGVVLAVQNHHDLFAHPDSLRDLLNAVNHPNCRAAFDAWAPALQGADLIASARALAALTVHTTVAGYQVRPRFRYNAAAVNYEASTPWVQAVPMDQNFIDYRGFLHTLREHGYRGAVAYEMCSPLLGGGSIENLDRCARAFLDWLRGAGQ